MKRAIIGADRQHNHLSRANMSSAQLEISLIMTVFNEGDTIQAVMESLLAQTRPPDEIVIVDGGSTDDT
ncbi:MAG: glycosyltransferase, partial [Anaerolineae bacterium]|nr:glycosyltransferase [Anaerolineae bacterium]